MAAIIPYTSSLNSDCSFGGNHLLNGCKRLKEKVSKCVKDEYKRLMKGVGIHNQDIVKIIEVSAIM